MIMAFGKHRQGNHKHRLPAPKQEPVEGLASALEMLSDPEAGPRTGLSNIGQSVSIQGELSAQEDINVDGRVEGTITLKGHNLTVGPTGCIRAEIHARSVVVKGSVVGNIAAEGRVQVVATGSVEGDILASRVVLEEGARFKGNIEMGSDPADPSEQLAQASEAALDVLSVLDCSQDQEQPPPVLTAARSVEDKPQIPPKRSSAKTRSRKRSPE